MKIGIVADIHEAINPLRNALAEFRSRGVDLVVSLGDACDSVSVDGRASEVVRLLREADAVGVWGNHDVGLSLEVSETLREAAGAIAIEYMAKIAAATCGSGVPLQPCRAMAGCPEGGRPLVL